VSQTCLSFLVLCMALWPARPVSAQAKEPFRHQGKTLGQWSQTLDDKDKTVRMIGIVALGEIGKPALTPLIAAISNKDKEVRFMAAYFLGALDADESRIVKALMNGYCTQRKTSPEFCVEAMINRRERIVPVLCQFYGSKNVNLKEQVLQTIGAIKRTDKKLKALLFKALVDPHKSLRLLGLKAVQSLGTAIPKAIPIIEAEMKKGDMEFILQAIEALAAIGPKARSQLKALRSHGNESVRQKAQETLKELIKKETAKE
jgi:HEAT repeat protein